MKSYDNENIFNASMFLIRKTIFAISQSSSFIFPDMNPFVFFLS